MSAIERRISHSPQEGGAKEEEHDPLVDYEEKMKAALADALVEKMGSEDDFRAAFSDLLEIHSLFVEDEQRQQFSIPDNYYDDDVTGDNFLDESQETIDRLVAKYGLDPEKFLLLKRRQASSASFTAHLARSRNP